MEAWRNCWRLGFAPQLTVEQLEALRQAVLVDSPQLLQGGTTTPPPLQCVQDWPTEAACPIAHCGVTEHGGFGTAKVGESEAFFAVRCCECDLILGEPASCRWFLNWWDETPRDEARREFLPEIERAILLKGEQVDMPRPIVVNESGAEF